MIISRFNQIAANGTISFFFMTDTMRCVCVCVCVCVYSVYICIYHIIFYPSIDRHEGCFRVSAVINSVTMNIRVRASFQIRMFFQI